MTLRARVHETSSTTGLGDYRLEGTSLGNRRFADAFGSGGSVVYFAVAEDGSAWEEVRGTFTPPDTLTRDEILDSSSGAKINWGIGNRNIFSAYSAKLMSAAPGFSASQALSLSDGRAEPHCFQHRLDTESGTSSDSCTHLETENIPDGCLLLLRQQDPGRTVTLSHGAGGAGQILLADGQDYVFADDADCILLTREGDDWIEVLRQRHDVVSKTGDTMSGALVLGAPSGGAQGDGTLNAEGVYVNGMPAVTDPNGLLQKTGDTMNGTLAINGPEAAFALSVMRPDNGPSVHLRSELSAHTDNWLGTYFSLLNDNNDEISYAQLRAWSRVTTMGAETGRLDFRARMGGLIATRLSIDGENNRIKAYMPVQVGDPAGGQQGLGSINAESLFVEGNPVLAETGSSIVGTGYLALGNGLVMQWGGIGVTDYGWITYPLSFPTNVLVVVVSAEGSGDKFYVYTVGQTVTGFWAYVRDHTGGPPGAITAVNWIAIGN